MGAGYTREAARECKSRVEIEQGLFWLFLQHQKGEGRQAGLLRQCDRKNEKK